MKFVAFFIYLIFQSVSCEFFFNDGPEEIKKNVQVSFRFVIQSFPFKNHLTLKLPQPRLGQSCWISAGKITRIDLWQIFQRFSPDGDLFSRVDEICQRRQCACYAIGLRRLQHFNCRLERIFDWSALSLQSHSTAESREWKIEIINFLWLTISSKKIAETFAELLKEFLENGYDIERLHLAGHSLGWERNSIKCWKWWKCKFMKFQCANRCKNRASFEENISWQVRDSAGCCPRSCW